MLPSSDYDSKVYVYALADAAPFLREKDAITRFVCEVLKVPPSPLTRISIAPASAWFEFSAIDELWARSSPPFLPEQAAAKSAAEAVLTALEKKCSDANPAWPKGLKGLALFPSVANLRRISLELVARRDGSGPDHWLYRAEPQLVLDGGGKTRAGVLGSAIEVRIGHMGRVIGLRSRWTPLSGEKILTTLSRYQPEEDGHSYVAVPGAGVKDDSLEHGDHAEDGHSEEAEQGSSFVNYVLDGDGTPQFYLAPYHVAFDGHHLNVSSASPYSLTVDIARIAQTRNGLTLIALASGGSGAYLYNWATYSLLAVQDGVHEIGPGDVIRIDNETGGTDASQISIGNTPCVMLLNVKDSRSGAFKHAQTQVFPSPWLNDTDPQTPSALTA